MESQADEDKFTPDTSLDESSWVIIDSEAPTEVEDLSGDMVDDAPGLGPWQVLGLQLPLQGHDSGCKRESSNATDSMMDAELRGKRNPIDPTDPWYTHLETAAARTFRADLQARGTEITATFLDSGVEESSDPMTMGMMVCGNWPNWSCFEAAAHTDEDEFVDANEWLDRSESRDFDVDAHELGASSIRGSKILDN